MEEFNRKAFFDCHESLEDLWRPLAPSEEKTFYQGILQVGVGFHHLQQGNLTGARSVMSYGLRKLKGLHDKALFEDWIDLTSFISETEAALMQLSALGATDLQKFPHALIPQIHLK